MMLFLMLCLNILILLKNAKIDDFLDYEKRINAFDA